MYECSECGTRVSESYLDEVQDTCPACGGYDWLPEPYPDDDWDDENPEI